MNGKAGILVLIILMIVSLCSCKKQVTVRSDDSNNSGDKSAAMIALINCSIIDGNGSFIEKDGVIVIKGKIIEQAGSSEEVKIPEDYEIIDLNGRTVLPGFFNCHVHAGYNEANLKNWLKSGVTTIRDMAPFASSRNITQLRDEYNKRTDTSRIVSATPILTVPGGYGTGSFSSVGEVKKVVNDYINLGVDIIKFSMCDSQAGVNYEVPTDEEWKALVETAHAGGKRATVHITQAKYLPLAAEIGVDEIAHMVSEPIDEAICSKLIEKDICWIPTLELWKGVSSEYPVDYEDIAVKNLGVFYRAGGRIALGTDYSGFPYEFDKGFPISEVKLMKEAGMENMDIIMAGTKNAAGICGLGEELGTIKAGKTADLLIVDGKPLVTIEDLQNTYMVIYNGQIAYKNE